MTAISVYVFFFNFQFNAEVGRTIFLDFIFSGNICRIGNLFFRHATSYRKENDVLLLLKVIKIFAIFKGTDTAQLAFWFLCFVTLIGEILVSCWCGQDFISEVRILICSHN